MSYGNSEILREYLWQSYVNCELVARSRLAGWADVEIELWSVQIEPAPGTLEDNLLFATASLSNGIVRSHFMCIRRCYKYKKWKKKEPKERETKK